MVLVEPPLGSASWDGMRLIDLIASLREVADSVEPGTPVAGQLPVTSDMFKAILRDGPKATLFAFLSVMILVALLFRNIRVVLICLAALLIGVIWLAGVILGWDIKINFLNFIAFPITFGIGVDYGVNIFQRYRLEGPGSILRVLQQTGGAVALASSTTIIGYGSLLIAGNQAFVSFGKLAVLGEFTCLGAAMLSMPAYIYMKDRKHLKDRRQSPLDRLSPSSSAEPPGSRESKFSARTSQEPGDSSQTPPPKG